MIFKASIGQMRDAYRNLVRKSEGKRLIDLGIDGTIILICIRSKI
jgi:hypothetical protein